MTVVTMTRLELSRVEVLVQLEAGKLTVGAAAEILGLCRCQVLRLRKRYRHSGPAGLVSGHRGRPSNHRLPEDVRATALALVRARYADFGPTLAAEKLAELHGIKLSRETLRGWMIADGLWLERRMRARAVHQPRYRRDCPGELVQIDGCEHWWFEQRGPHCTLLVFVDDATSRLMHLKFVPSESALAYLQATRDYIAAYGKPIAFYSDKHGIFRVNRPGAQLRGDGMTQFGRALHDLNIDILCANSCQAKGRVERAHLTLQDRLVKELRLQGISTVEAANRFLPGFIADYNQRFGKAPRNSKDVHRPLAPYESLDEALAWRKQRTVTANLTLHYNKVMFLLEPNRITRAAARQRVIAYDYPDGRLAIRWKGVDLPYRAFDKLRQVDQGAIVDNKRLSAALAFAAEAQVKRPRRRNNNLKRTAQSRGLMSLSS